MTTQTPAQEQTDAARALVETLDRVWQAGGAARMHLQHVSDLVAAQGKLRAALKRTDGEQS